MTYNKQTAVDWLITELNQELNYIPITQWDRIRDVIQRAKAMEKQQIIQARVINDTSYEKKLAEEYYNKQYGQQQPQRDTKPITGEGEE